MSVAPSPVCVGPLGKSCTSGAVSPCRTVTIDCRTGRACPLPTLNIIRSSGWSCRFSPTISNIGLDGVVYRELTDVSPEARIAMVVSTTNDRPVVRHFIDSVQTLDLNSG
jgi:hypothetical protein